MVFINYFVILVFCISSILAKYQIEVSEKNNGIQTIIRNEYTGPLCDDSKPCKEGFHCEKWNGNSFGTCKAVVSRHGLKEIHGISTDRIRNEYTGPLCDDSKPCNEGFYCKKWNGNSFGTCKAVVSRHGLKEIHGISTDRIRNEYTGPLCDDSKPCKEGFYCAKWDGNSFGTCKAVVSRHGLKEIHGISTDRIRNEYTGPLCDDSKPCNEGFYCKKWNGNSFGTCKAVVSRHGLKEIHGISTDRIRNEYTGPLCDDSKPCNEGFYCKKWNGNSFGTCKAVVSRHGLKEIHGISTDRIRKEYTGPLCDDSKPCNEGFYCKKWNGNSFGTCKAVVSRHGLKEIHGISTDRIRKEYTGPLCDDSKPCNEGFYCKKWNGNSFGTCKAVVRRLVLNDGSCKSAADCPSMHMCNILRGKSSGSCLPVSVRRLAQKDSVCNSNDDCKTGETCVYQNLGYYGVCVNVPVSRHSLKRNYGISADRIRNEYTGPLCDDSKPCNEGFYCKKWNGNSFGTCKAVVSRHGLKEIHGITADRIRNEYTGPLCDDSKPCNEGFYCKKWDGNSFGTCKAVVRRLRFNSFF